MNYLATMYNDDREKEKFLVEDAKSERDARIRSESEYGRKGWHCEQVDLILEVSDV